MRSNTELTNQEVAQVLREIGERLQIAGDTPFRVAAYRKAAKTVANCSAPVASIFEEEGEVGLRRLPGIGKSLARTTAYLLKHRHSNKLDRLRRHEHGEDLLRTLPGVGATTAERMHRILGIDTLDELFAAACDGRLRRVPGLGAKRLRSIRESLASRLQTGSPLPPMNPLYEPPVADLLSIDAEYRQKAARGGLPMAAPRLFNPTGSRWLPILHTKRGNYQFTAHFANTARSHRIGRFRDWVVITCDSKQHFGQWTVITASRGPLRGKRLVMHREDDCRVHYDELKIQLPLIEQ